MMKGLLSDKSLMPEFGYVTSASAGLEIVAAPAIGTVLSAAQNLLATLQHSEIIKAVDTVGYKSELEELVKTVESINCVLRDVERPEMTNHILFNEDEINGHPVFEADDLFDELVTLAKQKQLLKADESLFEKVSDFFSSKNPNSLACRMYHGVKNTRKNLKDFVDKHQFSFEIDSEPITRRRPQEIHQYVKSEAEIIGREADVEKIVGMLLHASDDQNSNVSVLSIVGMGGIGKTTLAQLVYNDPRVTNAFPFKIWTTCLSDGKHMEPDLILCEILTSIAHKESDKVLTMDEVQSQLQEELAGKKYLLVLDDVCVKKRDHWCKLEQYLRGGGRGSYIVVTTRSLMSAPIIMGSGNRYKLSGLSKENSWRLFKRTAFDIKQSNQPHEELFQIGKKIVDACVQVPLLIRVVGSLLYGQDKNIWMNIQEIGARIRDSHHNIMPLFRLLRLSFHHLEAPLKNCFRYCALFPTNQVIKKDTLIRLWMAQGYIVQSQNDESLEDAAQEHFSILMHRCFLEVVEQDVYGEIISCKLHDLIHDLACDVAGLEMCIVNNHNLNLMGTPYVDRNARHLNLMGTSYSNKFPLTEIRSLLRPGAWATNVNLKALMKNCKCLRTLELSNLGIKSLPDSISELLHLRYLDLSRNRDLEVLPKTITMLLNLETLILKGCHGLAELPKDLCRLVRLRVLDIEECSNLTCMPCGIGNLTSLSTLTAFVLGKASLRSNHWFDHLEDLEALQNLRGHLEIRILSSDAIYAKEDEERERAYLRNKVHLKHIRFYFVGEQFNGRVDHELLMTQLRPNDNLKGLDLCGYDSEKIPSWITLLQGVQRLHIEDCRKLQCLPYFGNVMFQLKALHLVNLLNLEYIFECSNASASGSNPSTSSATGLQSAEVLPVFPFLEELHLINLPELKGWFRSEAGLGVEDDHVQHWGSLFPQQIKSLIMQGCPKLKFAPQGSGVEEFSASGSGMSLMKETINPATKKTHDLGEIEEIEEDSSPADPSLCLNVRSPLITPLPPVMIADDADYSPPLSSDFQYPLQPACTDDDTNLNDALIYCSLFPHDHEFEKNTIVQLWVAQGIFHEEPMEEKAGQFFGDCLNKGYFEFSGISFLTGEALYKFKGDNHLVSRDNHVARLDGAFSSNDLPPEVSHVSIRCRSLNDLTDHSQFERFKQLKTLIFLQGQVLSSRQVPHDLFLSLNLLRVLDMSHICLVELPSSVGNMKSLRYLDLTKTPIKHLPEALDCLENLQTLKLRGCSNLCTLPKGMRKLENLRHLELDILRQLRTMPEGMGALTNIRTLSAFIVGVEEGRNIRQLKNMNNLSGSFCISGLQNVSTEDEAVEASLGDKSQLKKLELWWNDYQDKDVHLYDNVLSSLQPNASLEELRISCFGGLKLPFWICDPAFSKLVSITLFKCDNCLELPSVGQLPVLKTLNIVSLKKLKVIDHNFCGGFGIQGHIAFPMLEKLVIQDMSSLEEWKDTGNSHFPRLLSLSVKECPNLFSLCTLSSLCSLETLEVTHCGIMLPSCLGEELLHQLKTFIIEECPLISARILEDEEKDWLELVATIPNAWIDHEEISGLNSSEEEDSESENDDDEFCQSANCQSVN